MPLSEHEQRLLEQIEQALYAEDPKFASSYRNTDLKSHYHRRVVRCALLLVAGLVLLLAGVITKLTPLGVAGFVVMLVAIMLGIWSWQRYLGHRAPRPARPSRPSLRNRLEERWQRRWEDRGR
ncbi:MAG TPA: DUF3040 domain-containing protein [Mycobacteriales bacterium]|nr:DUF3040 domain-containing protein [Mycobacteriales bacterium]